LTHCLSAGGEALLLAGAAHGAIVLEAHSGAVKDSYAAEDLTARPLRGGFNAIALAGEYLFGTHSELGLVRWSFDQPGERGVNLLADRTSGARTVRHCLYSGGRVWLSVDTEVWSIPVAADHTAEGVDEGTVVYRGSGSHVTALVAAESRALAGNAEGDIISWPVDRPQAAAQVRHGHGRPVESVALLDMGGIERLFFTDTSATVHGQVMSDAFACLYRAGGQTIRCAEFTQDWIVGTNESRDRLLCWPMHRPGDPPTAVPIGRLTGHSVQDVCLVPQRG